MRRSRNFCQIYLVLSLFNSLKRGSNGFIAEKTKLIRGGPTFSRGGGVQMLISIETHIRTCYFPGVVRTPIRLWIRAWAMSS